MLPCTQKTGWDWLVEFRAWHPPLAQRTPEASSGARVQAYNRPNVNKCFDLLEGLFDTLPYQPSRIVSRPVYQLCRRSQTRWWVWRGTTYFSWKGSQNEIGAVHECCRRVRSITDHFSTRTRDGVAHECTAITPMIYLCLSQVRLYAELYICGMVPFHLVKHTNPTADRPVLLSSLMGTCSTLTKSLTLIELARTNYVTIIYHVSASSRHISAPDTAIVVSFRSLKTYTDQVISGGADVVVLRQHVLLWDTIPECIKNANSVDTFRTHCLKFLVKDVYNCMHFPIDTLEWLS